MIIAENIDFIKECPILKYLRIIPAENAGDGFDYSPLYEMPEIKSIQCPTVYGAGERFFTELDCERFTGLQDIHVTRCGYRNYEKISTLKSLGLSGYKKQDLTEAFSSPILDTLTIIQCKIKSLEGIQKSSRIQCLYLYYDKYLEDISALQKIKKSIKALRIENCPKIKDFSILGELVENRYPMSLKDNCLIRYLGELARMGVASLKLEGRMKRPEYVAIVTGIYRAALDGREVRSSDLSALRAAFSREGFTEGYYLGRTGPQMFGTRQPERPDRELLAAARATYENLEPQRVPVDFYAIVAHGQNAMLAVQDADGHICQTQGAVPQDAERRALTQDELAARLSKTGGTPYAARSVRSVVDPGLTLPAAEINRMRREVLAHLSAVRARRPAPQLLSYRALPPVLGTRAAPVFTVSVLSAGQITGRLLRLKPAVLYVPLSEVAARPDFFRSLAARQTLAVVLPRIVWDSETRRLLDALDLAASLGIRRALTGNVGQLSLLRSRGMEAAGDFGLNLTNSRAASELRDLGLCSLTASFELTLPQLRDLSKPLPTEMLVYGRLPLMLTENCLIRNRTGECSCGAGPVKLIDRKGEEFRIVRDCGTCRSVVLNGKKLYLLDKREDLRRFGLWALRLSFTTENPGEIDTVLSNLNAPFDPGACTRGLYYRGVE